MRLYEEFALSVSDDTIYRALKDLGFSHVSARPKAYKQDAEAITAFKKTSPLENNVHCPPRLGTRRSLIVRVGITRCPFLVFRGGAACGGFRKQSIDLFHRKDSGLHQGKCNTFNLLVMAAHKPARLRA